MTSTFTPPPEMRTLVEAAARAMFRIDKENWPQSELDDATDRHAMTECGDQARAAIAVLAPMIAEEAAKVCDAGAAQIRKARDKLPERDTPFYDGLTDRAIVATNLGVRIRSKFPSAREGEK